eukprot:CAMPEP_0198232660 /NCGR_PEP_ID=MMETSP1445-20131203/115847_1 /TAXON_ID=36898 /ORGANISM="Pyramimonas sp., Strain CCMP2087" /LENGTH=90 /DNA_ID=CAMNT_0043913341 /DNA_START=688 /DNA_END=959 /DNA_ORIENTATION=-
MMVSLKLSACSPDNIAPAGGCHHQGAVQFDSGSKGLPFSLNAALANLSSTAALHRWRNTSVRLCCCGAWTTTTGWRATGAATMAWLASGG